MSQEMVDLRGEMVELRGDMARGFEHVNEELRALRHDLLGVQRQIAQIGWSLSFALIAVLVGFIVAAL